MSPVIQDAADPRSQIVGFGDRHLFDAGMPGKMVWTRLPGDFGKPEYGVRRAEAIKKHLSAVICEVAWSKRGPEAIFVGASE